MTLHFRFLTRQFITFHLQTRIEREKNTRQHEMYYSFLFKCVSGGKMTWWIFKWWKRWRSSHGLNDTVCVDDSLNICISPKNKHTHTLRLSAALHLIFSFTLEAGKKTREFCNILSPWQQVSCLDSLMETCDWLAMHLEERNYERMYDSVLHILLQPF